MDTGYIKLWRKFENWEWFSKGNMAKFFIWLLLRATHKDTRFQGQEIKRGSMVFGIHSASDSTGISPQSIRTYIKALKSTNEITIKSTNKFSIITICNYDSYQSCENKINKQINKQTNNQLTSNQQATNNIQECKNIRKKEILTHTQRESFDVFYKAYPKKKAVADAERAWAKIDPSEALLKEMLLALECARGSEDWKKENGRYIPLPASWLNGRRWEDKLEPEKKGYDIWKTKPVVIPT